MNDFNIFIHNKCPITGLTIKNEREWINLGGQDHLMSLSFIGPNIVYTKQAGLPDQTSYQKAYQILREYTQEYFSPQNQYVLIEDVTQLKIPPKKIRDIPRKFHHQDYNKMALVICSPSIMVYAVVAIMRTIFKARIPLFARNSYQAAIELAYKISKKERIENIKEQDYCSLYHQRIQGMLNYLTNISWFEQGALQLPTKEDNHFKEIYSALSWIKHDFDEILSQKESAATKAQEIKDHFDILTDSSMDLILLIDSNGRVRYHSRSIINNKVLIDCELCKIFPPHECDRIHEYFNTTLLQGLNSSFESQIVLNPQKSIPVEVRLRKTIQNQTPYVFAIIRDISEQKSNELFKENLQREMFHSAKLASIGELAAGVGHEINNPLSIVYGNLELIRASLQKENDLTPEQKKILDRQEKAINRIADIVKGLKSFARQDDDSVNAIDINKTIDSTLTFIQEIYKKDGISIEKQAIPCPLFTLGNNGRLQQVLLNLLANAKDATRESLDPRINISVKKDSKNAIIKVTDNGRGIHERDLLRVFDNFFTTKETGQGTGLGLGIAKSIVEKYDGTISISSKVEQGTAVTVKLPLCDADQITPNIQNQTKQKQFNGTALVVDDETDIRIIMCDLLKGFGIKSESAANGLEALKLLYSNSYQYIFTDLKMPGMGGEELVEYVQANQIHKGKIFIVTGMLSGEASNLQVDGILEKPFDSHQVYQLLLAESE